MHKGDEKFMGGPQRVGGGDWLPGLQEKKKGLFFIDFDNNNNNNDNGNNNN